MIVGLECGTQIKVGWPAVHSSCVKTGRQAITLRSEGSSLRSWHKASTPAAWAGESLRTGLVLAKSVS